MISINIYQLKKSVAGRLDISIDLKLLEVMILPNLSTFQKINVYLFEKGIVTRCTISPILFAMGMSLMTTAAERETRTHK